ncbi:unnamed protein product [Phaeothamnion confervicola]
MATAALCVLFFVGVMGVLIWFFVEAWIFAISEKTTWLLALLAVSTCAVTISHCYCFYIIHSYGINLWDSVSASAKEEPQGVTDENKDQFCLFNYSTEASFVAKGASPDAGYRWLGNSLLSPAPKNAAVATAGGALQHSSTRRPRSGRDFGSSGRIFSTQSSATIDCEMGADAETKALDPADTPVAVAPAPAPATCGFAGVAQTPRSGQAARTASVAAAVTGSAAHATAAPFVGTVVEAAATITAVNGVFCAADLEDMCSICLGDYEAEEEVYLLPCTHLFHEQCLSMWIKDHSTCPFCKAELNTRMTEPSRLQRSLRQVRRFLAAVVWESANGTAAAGSGGGGGAAPVAPAPMTFGGGHSLVLLDRQSLPLPPPLLLAMSPHVVPLSPAETVATPPAATTPMATTTTTTATMAAAALQRDAGPAALAMAPVA